MSFVGNAVGKVVGGLTGANQAAKGAQQASDAQAQVSREALDLQREIYNQSRTDAQPWLQAGQQSLGQLMSGLQSGGDFNRDFTMADYQADPGYAFRLQQGQNALESSAAARGSNLSGATLKALTQYGQDMGSQEYQNAYNRWNTDRDRRFNRLSGVAGTGQTASAELQNAGNAFTSGASQSLAGIGNARASGYIAGGNATQNALSSGSGLLGTIGGMIFGGK